MDRDIKTVWSDQDKPMRALANGEGGDWMDQKIIDLVFGHPFIKALMAFF